MDTNIISNSTRPRNDKNEHKVAAFVEAFIPQDDNRIKAKVTRSIVTRTLNQIARLVSKGVQRES